MHLNMISVLQSYTFVAAKKYFGLSILVKLLIKTNVIVHYHVLETVKAEELVLVHHL